MNYFSTSLGASGLDRPVDSPPGTGAPGRHAVPRHDPRGDAPRFNAVVATSRVELVSLRRQALTMAKDRAGNLWFSGAFGQPADFGTGAISPADSSYNVFLVRYGDACDDGEPENPESDRGDPARASARSVSFAPE